MSTSEIIGLVGGITGLVGGLTALITVFWIRQQTRTADHQLFLSVARDVHEQYYELYPKLASLPDNVEQLNNGQRQAISQYANLCAEEYLWNQKGIIQPEVWEVWEEAIKDKFAHTVIGIVWKQDLRKDKYYKGFAEFIDGIVR
jgi:hypothetical protein